MAAYTIGISVALLASLAFVIANERYNLLSTDHFPNAVAKWLAYAWFAGFLCLLTFFVVASSQAEANAAQLASTPFWTMFGSHALLMIFLFGWWLLAGRPSITRFMNLQTDDLGQQVLIGVGVGVGGWLLTITIAVLVGVGLMGLGLGPDKMEPSPMIPWMASMAWWKKALIVLAAMTVEEFFFRAWLQKRVGLIISTIIFALAHAGYGQPLMLIGVTVVSLVIGITFWRTRRLIPCIIAHGVFDAIQLFIVIPSVLKLTGMGQS